MKKAKNEQDKKNLRETRETHREQSGDKTQEEDKTIK